MKALRSLRRFLIEHLWHRLVLPLGEPEIYTEAEVDLATRLRVPDKELSSMLLAEAQEIDRIQHSSAESIQSRAMTLQGAVAIATTLTLTAGGLVLDRTKIESHAWRIAFASVLLAAVLAFIASGVRALGASSRTYPWAHSGFNDIFDHAKLNVTVAQAAYAAAHLKSAGQNLRIVQAKAGYLNAAVRWFRVALALLAVLAAMFVAYTTCGEPSPAHPAPQASKSLVDHEPACYGAFAGDLTETLVASWRSRVFR
jgi:hypothetical protein